MQPAILLVDDDKKLLAFLERTLQPQYIILTATGIPEALSILHDHPVRLIISETALPEMNGFELCSLV